MMTCFRKIISALAVGLIFNFGNLWAEDIKTPSLEAPPLDAEHSMFNRLLGKIAMKNGVNYALLEDELRPELNLYLAQLAKAPWPKEKNEKMAHLINAYNAFTLALVVDRLPADRSQWKTWSIQSLGTLFKNPWKRFRFELSRQWFSLDQLEHEQLRPMGDPRIHFAINCASRSCPSLRPYAYQPQQLDQQLEDAAQEFAASKEHLRLEKGVLWVNPILSWFAEDFGKEPGVKAFLQQRASGDLRLAFEQGVGVHYFEYNWNLNLLSNQ